jgi:muramoyltetrapeptide carboxypeptidase
MPFARVLWDRLGDLGVPVLSDLPIGHDGEQWTIPIGLEAELHGNRVLIGCPAVC